MKSIIKLAETIANLFLSISNIFSLFHIRIIDKFQININKPRHEEEILSNTQKIDSKVEVVLSNQENEIKRLKEREKIIKEIVSKNLININNLNNLSKSEYFIVVPKLYTKLNKESRRILFENEGFYQNLIFKYFQEQNFINLGKTWSPVYIKNRDELKKSFRNFKLFKKFIDQKIISLVKKDNEMIKKIILNKKTNNLIKQYFFNENGKIRFEEYLFFDFMIISSLNLNEENITIFDEEAKINFISKILSHQIQDVKLKEIMIKSGIRLFLNDSFPKDIREKLINKNEDILKELKIDTFLDQINKKDLENVLKELLRRKYKKNYADEFMRVYNLIKEF